MVQHHPDLMNPELRAFDPEEAAVQPFPITTYQPILYCADRSAAAAADVAAVVFFLSASCRGVLCVRRVAWSTLVCVDAA
jgi:hypothetical protein